MVWTLLKEAGDPDDILEIWQCICHKWLDQRTATSSTQTFDQAYAAGCIFMFICGFREKEKKGDDVRFDEQRKLTLVWQEMVLGDKKKRSSQSNTNSTQTIPLNNDSVNTANAATTIANQPIPSMSQPVVQPNNQKKKQSASAKGKKMQKEDQKENTK